MPLFVVGCPSVSTQRNKLRTIIIYWSTPDTAAIKGYDATKGLFGGTQLPPGCERLFDFESTAMVADGTLGDGREYLGANWLTRPIYVEDR